MKITIEDYLMEVDQLKTKQYYLSNIQCVCDACKNYYQTIHTTYPKLVEFFELFGVDIKRPDETMWFESDEEEWISYTSFYTVNGSLIRSGEYEIDLDTLNIVISQDCDFPHGNQSPYFTISVYNIYLPWKLDEPFKEVFAKQVKLGLFKRLKLKFNSKSKQ